jgi:hypothetical protein
MGDLFEEWPQIGEQRELAHEKHHHADEADDERPVLSRTRIPPLSWTLSDGRLGNEKTCQIKAAAAKPHNAEERAAPADEPADKAAKRRCDNGSNCIASIRDGESLRYTGTSRIVRRTSIIWQKPCLLRYTSPRLNQLPISLFANASTTPESIHRKVR